MHISLEWLRRYVDIDDSTILEDLSLHTSEVESIVKQKGIDHVVIGEVKELIPHPNADKLRVAQIDAGEGSLRQIVCGAKNLEIGQKVPVALPGAQLAPDFVIKEAELRGTMSRGMICSEDELGLSETRAEGILVLPTDAPIGKSFFEYMHYNDTILEIDNKSITNRPDLFGHYGLARECSVIYRKPLKAFMETKLDFSNYETLPKLSVTIEEKDTCKRYLGVHIENIKPTSSPSWLRTSLEKVGIRSINSIVDVTNYVMLDLGQPLHAFDADKLTSKEIHVGYMSSEEAELTTLDGQDRSVPKSVLLIKDKETPIAIAGIMGLNNSEVSEQTQNIILEAAIFHPTTIRKGAQALSLRTEASMRFEKNLDPEMTILALEKAISLFLELHPEAKVASSITDIYPAPNAPVSIDLSYSFLKDRIGAPVETKEIQDILTFLGFIIEEKDSDNFTLRVPSWRATGDISMKEDIVEEITRILGFGNITPSIPVLPITPNAAHSEVEFRNYLRNLLSTQANLQEVQHYSFYSKKDHKNALLTQETIAIMNPLSSEQEMMRTHIVPHLLKTAAENLKISDHISAFEIEHVYPKVEGKFWDTSKERSYETAHLGIIAAHTEDMKNTWDHPYFHIKALLEDIFAALHLKEKITFQPISKEITEVQHWVHPKKAAEIVAGDKVLGVIAEVHPMAMSNFDIKNAHVAALELDVSMLQDICGEISYTPVSQFPAVRKDLAFLMDKRQYVGNVLETLASANSLIKDVEVFDIYEGEQVPSEKKSVTFALTLSNPERTLKDNEIQEVVKSAVNAVEKESGISMR
ncbi:MAG: phenylalanine--tRNA ligase subunit beta [Candidatus Gracilibacteria bacterium]